MIPPNLTLEEKPQTRSFVPDDDEHQGSNFLPEADAIDITGNPVKQQSIAELLINSEVLLHQGEEQQ